MEMTHSPNSGTILLRAQHLKQQQLKFRKNPLPSQTSQSQFLDHLVQQRTPSRHSMIRTCASSSRPWPMFYPTQVYSPESSGKYSLEVSHIPLFVIPS